MRAQRACRLEAQRPVLAAPLPDRSARLAEVEMLALDFETTGLDPQKDRIVAAGWVVMRGERILLSTARELRVRSGRAEGVGQSAVIHGILDSDLDEAAGVDGLVGELLPELAGRVIVAHAVPIERRFLNTLLARLGGVRLFNPFIDTLKIEQRLIEAEGGNVRELHGDLTLDACRERRGLPEHAQHSAGADAIACAELLLAQLARLGGPGQVTLRHLR